MTRNKLVLIIFSSFLYAMAQPNEIFHYGSTILGFIALIPLFYALLTCTSLKESILFGLLFGLFSTSIVYFWLLFFEDFSVWTLTGVVIVHILYFIILSPFITITGKYGSLRPFLIAAIWVCYEYTKSIGYTGFPWGLMVHSAGISPFVQIADITGQWGVSYLIVLINAMILETVLIRNKRLIYSWLFTIILMIGSTGYGIYINNKEIPWENSFNVLMVQQNADSWITGKEIESIKKGQDLTRKGLEQSNIKPDLILWSENAFRYPYIENSSRYKKTPVGDPFSDFLEEIDTHILVGSPYIINRETSSALNAALLISPDGRIVEYYGKSHLVPFAENIPFWNIPLIRLFFKNVIGIENEGWSIGESNIIFKLPVKGVGEVKFGVPICFEDSFPCIARNFIKSGADILINLSNDSWSKTVAGETQHLAAARLRSIETRRIMIRSTNAGVSTVIDPWGKMNYTLPLYKPDTTSVQIPLYIYKGYTVYTILGDWFPVILILILIIYRLYDIFIKKSIGIINRSLAK